MKAQNNRQRRRSYRSTKLILAITVTIFSLAIGWKHFALMGQRDGIYFIETPLSMIHKAQSAYHNQFGHYASIPENLNIHLGASPSYNYWIEFADSSKYEVRAQAIKGTRMGDSCPKSDEWSIDEAATISSVFNCAQYYRDHFWQIHLNAAFKSVLSKNHFIDASP